MVGYFGMMSFFVVVLLAFWRGWEAERDNTHTSVSSLLQAEQTGLALCALFVQVVVARIVRNPDFGGYGLLIGLNVLLYCGFVYAGWKASELFRSFRPPARPHWGVIRWWIVGLLLFVVLGAVTVLWQNRTFSEYPEMRDGWSLSLIYGMIYSVVTLPLVYVHILRS